MKKKYMLSEDGFEGYRHPGRGHEGQALIVFPRLRRGLCSDMAGVVFSEKAGWPRLLAGFADRDGLPADLLLTPVEYAQRALNMLKPRRFPSSAPHGKNDHREIGNIA